MPEEGDNEFYSVRNGQTKTPEFKKWFGDSKAVDENGKPLIVYHGTNADFSIFKVKYPELLGKHPEGSGFYFTSNPADADEFADIRSQRTDGDNVVPAYLSIQNPLTVNYKSRIFDMVHVQRFVKQALDNSNDGVVIKNIKNFSGFKKSDTYIAFSPAQIKSATGNNGAFDAGNPDIRSSIRKSQNPPVSSDPKVLNLYLKDETDAIAKTIKNKLHPGRMTWLETILKSPEWFDHPQINKIVKLFMRDRNEIYH